MVARPYKMLAKMMAPMAQGVLKMALEKDMDAVKRYCEGLQG